MKVYLTFILFLILSINVNSQEKANKVEALKSYIKSLNLNEAQKVKFSKTFNLYTDKLLNKDLEAKEFNNLLKLRANEFYKILTEEQFKKYKSIKKDLEPGLDYKFKNN